MSNFLRALRFTWPYRGRLFLSWGCAVLVGVLWAANISAIYPIVKLLFDDDVNGAASAFHGANDKLQNTAGFQGASGQKGFAVYEVRDRIWEIRVLEPTLKVTDGSTTVFPTRTLTFDDALLTVTDEGDGNAGIQES